MIAVGFRKGGEKLLCCLFAISWKPASMEQPFASEATIFTPCRSSWLSSQSHVQQQRLDSSVLWALPSPISCTPHSSSGFAILFSAASCTKLCCDCAVGLDMAKRIQRSPFSSYQTTLQSSLHPVPFSPFVFNFKVSVLQGGWMQDRYYIKLYCYLRCNKAV